MKLSNFKKLEGKLGFKLKSPGVWANEAKGLMVRLDEDYKRSYHAYVVNANGNPELVLKNGKPKRFQLAENAAAYALELKADADADNMRAVLAAAQREVDAMNAAEKGN